MKDTYKREMQRIASRIRNVREYKRLSQEFVASRIGISQNAYSKIELGYSKITLDRFFHLANLLDVEVAELLGRKVSAAKVN
jgi:transcriptional regulator with XRE-family HTH domain